MPVERKPCEWDLKAQKNQALTRADTSQRVALRTYFLTAIVAVRNLAAAPNHRCFDPPWSK